MVSPPISFLGNRGLAPDDRGRIPYWGEEKEDLLLKGRRAGELRPDAQTSHKDKPSVLITVSGDWFGLASINYPITPATDRHELSAWVQCDAQAKAMLLACWTDDQGRVVKVDQSAETNDHEWHQLLLSLVAPAEAASVRLVNIAHGGRAWFADCDLRRLPPSTPRLRVFVNQVGYDTAGPKSVVVASSFLPADHPALSFQLIGSDGKSVWTREVSNSGRIYGGTDNDWGWYFWRADFSEWRTSGQFRACAQWGNLRAESPPFPVAPGVLLRETARNAVDFFFVQRCGFDVPGWHKPCHLDDAKLPDGTHLDATGGWHSAGDYNKLMYEHGDGGVVFALLKALQSAPDVFSGFDRDSDGVPDALDEAIWGAGFVAKMQVPETGALRNHVNQGPGRQWTKWSAPEDHTDNIVGTADDPIILPGEGSSPLAIGGWARLSAMLDQRGRTNDYLRRALRLWNHATGGGTNVASAYLLLSALDLHAVSGQPAFLDSARRAVESLLAQQVTSGRLQGAFGTYGEAIAASLASFALAQPQDPLTPRTTQALRQYLIFCTRQADNAFGFSRQPAGEAYQFFPPDMGSSFQVLSRAWAAVLIFRLTRDPAALRFATDQMDWLLGKNPYDLCLFEGKGSRNPPRYHHRYNAIPGHERGAVPGTVPNGFVREMGMADRPGLDLSRGGNRAPSFRTSEPWLVHNLFYLLAVSELNAAVQSPPR
jgi:hypothetical protein